MKKRLLISVVLLVVLAMPFVILAGCSEKKGERTIKVGFLGKLENLNPLETTDPHSWQVLDAVLRGMYRWNDKWEKEPVLVETLPNTENGDMDFANKIVTIKFKMRQNLRWSDGTPLTADDAYFTYEMSYSPFFKEFNQRWVSEIRNVTIVPPSTVVFTLHAMDPDFNVTPLSKAALNRPFMTSQKEELDEILKKSMVYSGPYKVEKWSSRQVILRKNDNYFTPAKTPKIELSFYHREMDLLADLQKGKLDIGCGLTTDSMNTMAKNPKFIIKSEISATQQVLVVNYKNPLLVDGDFRKAIAMSIDKKALSESIYPSKIFASESWLPPRHKAYKPVLIRYEDAGPDDITALLKKAGMEKNASGVLMKGDTPVSLMLNIVDGDKDAFLISEFVKDSLKKQGIEVNVVSCSPENYRDYLKARKNYDLALVNVETSPTVALAPLFRLPPIDQMTKEIQKEYRGHNYGGWANVDDDTLANLYFKTPQPEKRLEILQKQQDLFAENLPFIPLLNKPENVVYKVELDGIVPRGFGSLTWNIENWSWK